MVLAFVLLASAGVTGLSAEDWPQFLGPERNGVYRGPALSESWGSQGPRVVWRKNVGQGFSGPVVAQDRVILFHRVGTEEVVEAFDARTGAGQWRYAYTTSYRDDFGFDEGPRAVPVVANGIVYTFGAQGQLHAIDLAKGTRVWSDDTMQRFRVPKGFFGAAGSPLVEDGRVLANIGGPNAGIVAFDATTGKVLWTATSDQASYSSAAGATIAGRRVAIFLTRAGLVGLDPGNRDRCSFNAPGGHVWPHRSTWRRHSSSTTSIFISAEYGPGAGLFRLDGTTLNQVWASDEALTNHYATSVHYDGYLYGFHGRQEFGQSFRAVELQTGKVRWSQDRFLAGTVTLAGDRLVILRERGELVVAPAIARRLQAAGASADPDRHGARLPGVVRRVPVCAQREHPDLPGPATSAVTTCSRPHPTCSALSLWSPSRGLRRVGGLAGAQPTRRSSRGTFSIVPSPISCAAASPNRRRDSTRSSRWLAGRRAAAVAARHRPVLRRPLRRLPQAVRAAPHCQSRRRRERRVALPLRRTRRITRQGEGRAAAGRSRCARADATDLPDVSRASTPEDVLQAAGAQPLGQFYRPPVCRPVSRSDWRRVTGARAHHGGSSDRYADAGGYMQPSRRCI